MDRYRLRHVIVLESPAHGPEACLVVMTSLPPQGRGLPLVGWDWSAVEAESIRGTTWATVDLVGTYDGSALTVLSVEPLGPRPPLRPQVDQRHRPPGGPTDDDFERIQRELADADLGVFVSVPDWGRGAVAAMVPLVDDGLLARVRDRWGDLVRLESWLEPVD